MDLISSLITSEALKRSNFAPDCTYGRYVQIYGDDAYVAFATPKDLLVNLARLLVRSPATLRVIPCKLPDGYRSHDLPEASLSFPLRLEVLKEAISSFEIDLSEIATTNHDKEAVLVPLTSLISEVNGTNVDETLQSLAVVFGLEVARFTDGVRLEYLGLEVARRVDGINAVVVGSSERDRQARELMYLSGYDVREEIGKSLSQLKVNRSSFRALHPHALFSRDRWMRVLVTEHPDIVGFQSVRALEIGSLDETTPRCYGIGESLDGSSVLLCFASGPDIVAPFESLLLLQVLRCSSKERFYPTKISFITQRQDVTEAFRTILKRSSQDWEIVSVSERWFDLPEKRNLC